MTDVTEAIARQAIEAQPFSTLIGARLERFDATGAALSLPIRDELRQQLGYVHGGVIAYAADNTLTLAGAVALGADVLTAGFTIDYLRPAREGVLLAEAVVIDSTDRKASCRCEVFEVSPDGERTLCATATGTIVAHRPSGG